MMRTLCIALMLSTLPVLCRDALGNGDTWTYLRDPRTGAILPTKPTSVRIERERLDVELVERLSEYYDRIGFEYGVHVSYWMHNPTNQSQHLKVAFPIPNSVLLRETPILLDGNLVAWRLLESDDFLELHRRDMQFVVRQMLRRSKALRQWLGAAMRMAAATPPPEPRNDDLRRSYEPLPKVTIGKPLAIRMREDLKLSAKASLDDALWEIWQARPHKGNATTCPIQTLFHVAKGCGGYRIPLFSQWEVTDWYLSPVSRRVLLQEKLDTERESIRFSVLLFEFTVKPGAYSRLDVRYRQQAGAAYHSGLDDSFIVPGLHFAYIIKVRKTWGFFGPIDVVFRIPPDFRLRSVPDLRYMGVARGRRLYTGRLQPYRHNLYVVAGTQETFNPEVEVITKPRGGYYAKLHGRQLTPRDIYVRADQWFSGFNEHQPILRWDDTKRQATVYCQQGKHTVLSVNEHTAWTHGKRVELPAPVRLVEKRVWIPIRGLPALTGDVGAQWRLKSIYQNPQTGEVTIYGEETANRRTTAKLTHH